MSSTVKRSSGAHTDHPAVRSAAQAISEFGMLQPEDSVLAGVSGGPDSVALVSILQELAPVFSFRVGIAHFDHCLRGEDSHRDAEFVASLAEKLGLPFYIKRKDVGRYKRKHKLSLEEAARQLRYAFYDSMAAKHSYSKIALGHHADDNAELILMFIIRGSGTVGGSGIPPIRDGRIIRPLIRLTRQEIIDYLDEKGLECVSDRSNLDNYYLRNRIRNRLIPQLKESYNAGIVRNLNRFADILRNEKEWLEDIIAPIYTKVVSGVEKDHLCMSLTALQSQPEAVKRRLVRKAIAGIKGDLRRVSFSHVAAVIKLMETGPTRGDLDLPGRIRISRNGEMLYVSKEKCPLRDLGKKPAGSEEISFSYPVDRPDEKPGSVFIREAGLQLRFSTLEMRNLSELHRTGQELAFFDMNKIEFPLVVRNLQPGDRFRPLGMAGSQKVKKFFIDHKIPVEQRSRCPVLLSRDRIIWVVGHRIDEGYKVSGATRSVLKVALSRSPC